MLRTTVVLRVVGAAILGAAVLKIHGALASQPAAPWGFLANPWVQVGITQVELLLGVFLLMSGQTALKWIAACCLFTVFTAVNLWMGIEGRSSCGCLGAIPTSPWWMFAADLGVLALLGWMRPPIEWRAVADDIRHVLRGVAFAALVPIALLGGVVWTFGSLDAAIASVRGESCTLTPEVVDFGAGQPGEIREATLHVTNRSAEPLRIVGGSADCSFVATKDLPALVQPGDSLSIHLVVRFPAAAGRFLHRGNLVVGHQELSVALFQYTGVTVEADDGGL